uniref:Adenylate kinase isoenzyme 6 homolog n=1 Tax=Caligus rogercresseyi TaxID=217165 RepID=C1BND0_CALRO|nr:Adenylate kinase isoenzyme 6 [Caligus rogercresseyi]|eukprot:TRINITY_DN2480_c0_g1_i1.p1 TRINITY_DN2480_c0_g1~~TRINITY_DN2480_c0_g1_i1.p1  ORF type:complete len:201 (+),score=72.22 TRINITY_DN2480_c0_g1_i1:49-651(+)
MSSDSAEGGSPSPPKKKMKKPKKKNPRSIPNILITGTPGTGKSRLSKSVSEALPDMKWINIGEYAKEHKFLGEWDEKYQCHELDEDPLLDSLEAHAAKGGLLIDHHIPDLYPERFFDAVFVLRAKTSLLHDRLSGRGYKDKKLEDNIQCEIFQTILEESRESYDEKIVFELPSNHESDLESNIESVKKWIGDWIDNKKKS